MTDLQVGEDIAGYRVIELVGSGGMGRVYRALHPLLERIVALKVIRPEVADDEAFRERFRREARLIASVDHPSVVPVYDAEEADGVLFIAMRWVAGSDLRRVLALEGPLEPARAVRILSQIAEAVDAAHAVGLIHRDIKPANVLLEGDRAFLSDFGVSRLLAAADASTVTGGFVGTVDYAAPELLDGELGTVRADIYALGCVLYEMLTGSVPYPIESLLAKLHAHAHDDRPVPSARRPDLPRGLDDVVLRTLSIDPAKRFATAGELAAAAQRALRTPPVHRAAAPRRRRLRRRAIIGISLVLAAAGILAAVLALATPGRADYAPGGRALPAVASLRKCSDELAGPPRACYTATGQGGEMEIGDEHATVRMSTMNVEVTGVTVTPSLTVSSTGGEVLAPRGTRFVLVDLAVKNVTHREQEFEPSEAIDGRLTGLWLITAQGKTLPWQGPREADYSVEDQPAVSALEDPLYQASLPPGQQVDGQLAFYYPETELRSAKLAYLEIKELGEPFGVLRSQALIRLSL